MLVVAYHLAPGVVSGGYVGVDVFFVISGFLITSHLVKEHERTGGISLLKFYARRIRRLLPAALLVLLLVAAAYAILMPESTRQQGFREIAASAVYVENWVLAFSSVDYLGAAAAPSLVQHYWSLSVEEQFYIVWPVLLVVAGLVARRISRERGRRVWTVTLWAVFALSLVFSVIITAANPGWAYFVTPARAWEFAAGGLVALYAGAPGIRSAAVRTAAAWLGLLAILASAFVFTPDTPFPGFAALLPVLGAALLIAAGDPRTRWSPMLAGRIAPVQFVGGISYAVYLWHWPLIVLFPVVVGHPVGIRGALLVVAVTLVLSTASKYLVEDPFLRRGKRVTRVWPTLAAAAAVMAVLVTVSGVQIAAIDTRLAAAAQEQQDLSDAPCYGARALTDAGCGDPRAIPADLDTAFAATDYADTTLGDCGSGTTVSAIGDAVECSFGDESSDKLVVVIGDSHAGHWLPPVQAIGADRDWHIVTFFRSSCPFTDATPSASGVFQTECENWKGLVEDRVADLSPSLVLVASLNPHGYEAADFQPGPVDVMQAGYVSTLGRLEADAGAVAVLRDTPFMGVNVPDCLGASSADPESCNRPRAEVLDANADPLWAAAATLPSVARLDLTDAFCDAVTCFAVTGGVVIYRDHHHMSASFSRSLAPRLLDRLTELVAPLP
jgi:peptidoglycan/LPS O-acetylase OafA/YrhL